MSSVQPGFPPFFSPLYIFFPLFKCALASLKEGLADCPSVRLSVRPSVHKLVSISAKSPKIAEKKLKSL